MNNATRRASSSPGLSTRAAIVSDEISTDQTTASTVITESSDTQTQSTNREPTILKKRINQSETASDNNNQSEPLSKKSNQSPTSMTESPGETFMSKFWEDSARAGKTSCIPNVHIHKWIFRFWFQFQAWTMLYMTLWHMTPFLFADLEPDTRYYLKVFFVYLFAMCQANWVAAIFYKSNLPDYRDKADPEGTLWEKPQERFMMNMSKDPWMDKHGALWKYCNTCERYRPPRAHHCKLCETCILRRDHHCYMIGTCIGHYNQRFFISLLYFSSIVTILALTMTIRMMSFSLEPEHWYDYVLPCTAFKYAYGGVSGEFCMLSFHAFTMCIMGPMAMVYCSGQMIIASTGYTLYEIATGEQIVNTLPYRTNLNTVFGDYWMTSFLFPSIILFKQRNDGTYFEGVHFGDAIIEPNTIGKTNVE